MPDSKETICPVCGAEGVARNRSFILKVETLKVVVKYNCLSCDTDYIKEYDMVLTNKEIICQSKHKGKRHYNDE